MLNRLGDLEIKNRFLFSFVQILNAVFLVQNSYKGASDSYYKGYPYKGYIQHLIWRVVKSYVTLAPHFKKKLRDSEKSPLRFSIARPRARAVFSATFSNETFVAQGIYRFRTRGREISSTSFIIRSRVAGLVGG